MDHNQFDILQGKEVEMGQLASMEPYTSQLSALVQTHSLR